MKVFLFKIVALLFTAQLHASVIFQDDFTSGSVTNTFRIYESNIDDGWHKGPVSYSGQPESAWTITGGQAENSSSLAATGYPDSKEAEAPLFAFFSGNNSTDGFLELSFDYSVAAGDTLYAHFWGATGISDDDNEFISNIEGSANGNVNLNAGTGDTTELTTYNLLDGAASGFGSTASSTSGALTGSGTYSTVIDIASLGIAGVTTAQDIDYYVIQFAQQEDGLPGTTSLDNFSLITIPEPSSIFLVGVLLLFAVTARNRRVLTTSL